MYAKIWRKEKQSKRDEVTLVADDGQSISVDKGPLIVQCYYFGAKFSVDMNDS